jgi:hypothetical protein
MPAPNWRINCPLRFSQPLSGHGDVGMIEVFDGRPSEGLGDLRQGFLPIFFTDHRQTVDVVEMMHPKRRVGPHGASRPAVEASHIEQHVQFPVQPDEPPELWHKGLVIRRTDLAADVDNEQFPVVFLTELDGHNDIFSLELGGGLLGGMKEF